MRAFASLTCHQEFERVFFRPFYGSQHIFLCPRHATLTKYGTSLALALATKPRHGTKETSTKKDVSGNLFISAMVFNSHVTLSVDAH